MVIEEWSIKDAFFKPPIEIPLYSTPFPNENIQYFFDKIIIQALLASTYNFYF